MKTFTIYSFLGAAVVLVTMGGCKKLDSSNNNGGSGTTGNTPVVNKYTNPNTAAAVCDYDVNVLTLTNHPDGPKHLMMNLQATCLTGAPQREGR